MYKKVVFLIAPRFRDEELRYPMDLLKDHGIQVFVASKTKGQVEGSMGMVTNATIAYNAINSDEYNAIVFVGGQGAQVYFNDPIAMQLAQDFLAKKKIVAAICIAPAILANAGLLKGKYSTCHASESTTLRGKGGLYTGDEIAQDGLILTAKGPQSAMEFGKKLLHMLGVVVQDRG